MTPSPTTSVLEAAGTDFGASDIGICTTYTPLGKSEFWQCYFLTCSEVISYEYRKNCVTT